MASVKGNEELGYSTDDSDAASTTTTTEQANRLIKQVEDALRKVVPGSESTAKGKKKTSKNAPDQAIVSFLSDVLSNMREIGEQVANLNNKFAEVIDKLTSLENENRRLRQSNETKDKKVAELEMRIDKLEWNEHRNQVTISSPDIASMGNNFKEAMVEHTASKLRMAPHKLKEFTYKKVGRVQKKALVTIPNEEDRITLFKNARTIQPAKFFVNEAVSEAKGKLLYDIRQYRKSHKKRCSVYSFKGSVYVRKNPDADPILVRSVEDVTNLQLEDYVPPAPSDQPQPVIEQTDEEEQNLNS